MIMRKESVSIVQRERKQCWCVDEQILTPQQQAARQHQKAKPAAMETTTLCVIIRTTFPQALTRCSLPLLSLGGGGAEGNGREQNRTKGSGRKWAEEDESERKRTKGRKCGFFPCFLGFFSFISNKLGAKLGTFIWQEKGKIKTRKRKN
jgi:hypothetical protein